MIKPIIRAAARKKRNEAQEEIKRLFLFMLTFDLREANSFLYRRALLGVRIASLKYQVWAAIEAACDDQT